MLLGLDVYAFDTIKNKRINMLPRLDMYDTFCQWPTHVIPATFMSKIKVVF